MSQTDRLEFILEEDDGPVRYLTLNRPERANAMNVKMLEELDLALTRAGDADPIRVVVIRGAGRGFSSGADMNEAVSEARADGSREPVAEYRRITSMVSRWFRIWDFPKPVIAEVHGYCIGIATQLASVC